MAKIYSVHYWSLNPGIQADDFERFIREEVYPATVRPDLKVHIIKGERGKRTGQYSFLMEFESIEARDRYWPEPNQASEAGDALTETWFEKWGTFVSASEDFTDYVEVTR